MAVILSVIQNIVDLMLGHHQRVALSNGIDVKKSIEAVVFSTLVRRNFSCDDS